MPRYVLKVEGERHGFVNMISDQVSSMDKNRFVASRVRHPLSTAGEVILEASDESEAREVLIRTCEAIEAKCKDMLEALGMSDQDPPLLNFAHMPDVTLQTMCRQNEVSNDMAS